VDEHGRAGTVCGSVRRVSSGTATTNGWARLARPTLRSGLQVCRRDDHHLQIGLDDPDRLVLPDLPGLQAALEGRGVPVDAGSQAVLDRLVSDGWVLDEDEQARLRREATARRPPVALTVDPLLGDVVARACSSAGLRVADRSPVRLLVALGEPRRRVADALMRDDVPHLWVTVHSRRVRLGPFVEPGRSACLRCVDAHLGDRDPRRGTVLHQLEERTPATYHAPDPSLLALAAAWAVRDVVRRLDGEVPSLRSADVTVTDELDVTRREWLRHPHCGCAWG
jgi:hypothetical protein